MGILNNMNMDSVFSNAIDDDIEFDTFFDQEDDLIDIVEGFGKSADPIDNSVDDGEIGRKSDADKFTMDSEKFYHTNKMNSGYSDSIEDMIDKVVESNYMDIDDILDSDDDEPLEGCRSMKESNDITDEDSDDALIDIAMGQEENDSAEEKYAYDISDEDLIDIAMNND